MSTKNGHDRQALLTASIPDTTAVPSQRKKYCKLQLGIIAFAICLIIALGVIFLFVIYDVFDLKTSSKSIPIPGMIGLWPSYGGSLQNQQKPASTIKVQINPYNVKHLKTKCIYKSPNGSAVTGYPTIDDDYNAYFSDLSGYITSINLDTCDVIWRTHIGILLGYNESIKVLSAQSLTLFQDSNGDQGALFAAPQSRWSRYGSTYPNNLGCYAIAVHLNNGSLWWRINIGKDDSTHNYLCGSHGFYIDGKYAFGGMSQSSLYDADNGSKFIGRYLKIDIDTHQIKNQWYPFHLNLTEYDEYNTSYLGVAAYNFPAMIDDYLVFGTGNLYRSPKYIDDCLTFGQFVNTSIMDGEGFNDFLKLNDSHYMDLCGNDESENRFWRCLQKKVYIDSLIILNKTNFNMLYGFPLQGMDIFYGKECKFNSSFSKFCPSSGNQGVNADLTAVATFKNKENGKLYVAASQKSARIHIFELETGKLMISKKYGPASDHGQFSMALDEDSMIGITSITGQSLYNYYPRYKLANNLTVCDGTGSIHAFDINTGNTLWQIVNPYGTINESKCFNDSDYKYIDYTESTNCEYGDFVPPSETAFDRVIIPPKSNDTLTPISSKSRAYFRAPVTIINNMVFIPSSTGDIWVHHLLNGSFIHHLTCPNTLQLINETTNKWNRSGIKGGISIVHDRIIFYCGSYYETTFSEGNIFVSMQLQS